jgi:voltage-dependent calcium channel L type alpha-1D
LLVWLLIVHFVNFKQRNHTLFGNVWSSIKRPVPFVNTSNNKRGGKLNTNGHISATTIAAASAMHAVNMSPSDSFDPNQFAQLNDVHNHITKGILQARVNNELAQSETNRSLPGPVS